MNLTNHTINNSGMSGKIFGAPLQHLYQSLIKLPQGPRQPELIRTLTQNLAKEGLSYHPRTIKRQLLGNIEYIPESLEHVLLTWIQAEPRPGQDALLENFMQEKSRLEESKDNSLYISPQSLTRMANAYLYLHKDLSRRQLALKLTVDLEKRGVQLGLETLQAALAGKTRKVRKIVAEQLKNYFAQEGWSTPAELDIILQKVEAEGKQEVQKIEVGEAVAWADAYLLKHRDLSKRQLALALQSRLESKGYRYHLSSIQSVLEGKTRKTRKVILDTLESLLQSEGIEAGDVLAAANEASSAPAFELTRYVSAESIPLTVESILAGHPQLTRRRIAQQLQEDLRQREFNFSLSTLQYLLAGKTQRVKKVIMTLLESYLQAPDLATRSVPAPRMGRQSLQKRVEESRARMVQAPSELRTEFRRHFLAARQELIKRISERRRHSAYPNSSRRGRPHSDLEALANEGSFDATADNVEISVAYDVDVKEAVQLASYG